VGVVSSSIKLKGAILETIVTTYKELDVEHYRKAQKKGAAVRRQQTFEEAIPAVLKEIGWMFDAGIKPAYRNFTSIPHYLTTKNLCKHTELLEKARGLKE
jgi:hypothetical protein